MTRLLIVATLLLLGTATSSEAAVKADAIYTGGNPPTSYRTTGPAILINALANGAGD